MVSCWTASLPSNYEINASMWCQEEKHWATCAHPITWSNQYCTYKKNISERLDIWPNIKADVNTQMSFPLPNCQLSISSILRTKVLQRTDQFFNTDFFFFIFLLGFWSIFKFSPHIFLFRHSIEFSTYCRSIWKFSCRMVKTGESYKQLEVEFWKETPTNPKLKLSTALQSSIMPTASSDYLSS